MCLIKTHEPNTMAVLTELTQGCHSSLREEFAEFSSPRPHLENVVLVFDMKSPASALSRNHVCTFSQVKFN